MIVFSLLKPNVHAICLVSDNSSNVGNGLGPIIPRKYHENHIENNLEKNNEWMFS